MRRATLAEQIMESRDLEILSRISYALEEIAEDFDLHVEQVRALWIGALSDEEIRYAQGDVQ